MKKITLVALFATILAFAANAQKSGFGIKGGFIGSNIEFEDGKVHTDPLKSGYGGLCFIIKASNHWAFQPEILYSAQGCEINKTLIGKKVSAKLNLNYIQIPVLAKYYFNSKWALEFGPQFQVLTSSELEAEAFGLKGDTNTDNLINKYDVGIAFGTSVHIQEQFFIDLRLNAGINNIFNDNDEVKAYNRSFQVGIGYTF